MLGRHPPPKRRGTQHPLQVGKGAVGGGVSGTGGLFYLGVRPLGSCSQRKPKDGWQKRGDAGQVLLSGPQGQWGGANPHGGALWPGFSDLAWELPPAHRKRLCSQALGRQEGRQRSLCHPTPRWAACQHGFLASPNGGREASPAHWPRGSLCQSRRG